MRKKEEKNLIIAPAVELRLQNVIIYEDSWRIADLALI
jgi:hypothetical protein